MGRTVFKTLCAALAAGLVFMAAGCGGGEEAPAKDAAAREALASYMAAFCKFDAEGMKKYAPAAEQEKIESVVKFLAAKKKPGAPEAAFEVRSMELSADAATAAAQVKVGEVEVKVRLAKEGDGWKVFIPGT